MGCPFSNAPKDPDRRKFLGALGLFVAAIPAAYMASNPLAKVFGMGLEASNTEDFWGLHQNGITTPMQTHTSFAAFDLTTDKKEDAINLLQTWTQAASRMTNGQPAQSIDQEVSGDSDEVLGMSPSRLTINFGFGPGLFTKGGVDRYGIAKLRPEALIDLPRFIGDKMQDGYTGGDLCIQACADDSQVTFHALRQLDRLAYGTAEIKWSQNGFIPKTGPAETPRNLMGFKDGTMNPSIKDPQLMSKFIWVGNEGPAWMNGGTYMVVRKIRISLEHWDRMKLAFQEQTMGRHKLSGAPLGAKNEHDPLDLDANDADGNPIIPENSHVRLGAPQNNDGAQILRRSYSYDNNLSYTVERWPPWHQGMELDAGLLFQCFQRDPRTGFVKIFDKMSRFDMMNQFVTHIGSGIFAYPPGASKGGYIGQGLFS